MARQTQQGFTIIELIVVIALLGILSAVALPRFINVTSSAHDAAVEGAGAGLATGVALFKAQVVANGELGSFTTDVQGYGDGTLEANTKGYPVGTSVTSSAATLSADNCVQIWSSVLDANGPSVSTAAGEDFQAATDSGTVEAGTCTYTYRQQKNGSDRLITYVTSTGEVSVTIP